MSDPNDMRAAGSEQRAASPRPTDNGQRTTNWPRLYALVLATLALDIALFYWFTKAFQ